MIHYHNGVPFANIKNPVTRRLTYKQIAQRSRTYRTTQRLLAALKK